MFDKMKRKESIINWLIKQSWFFSAFLFLGLIISGNIDSKKDFFAILTLCLSLWVLEGLFLKKGVTILLNNSIKPLQKMGSRFRQEKVNATIMSY
jgi:hypothetical protein